MCDGVSDCDDGSDEIADSCNQMYCASFSYRCSYGACVIGSAECNGIQDCADNSDETSINCPGQSDVSNLNGNCTKSLEYQCKSGQCIEIIYLCDGIVNCSDGSDETEFRCHKEYCPKYAFQCSYGACVSGEAKCDRKIDCADRSDETEELCGYVLDVVTPTSSPVTRQPPPNSCIVQDTPDDGFVVYAGDPSVTLQRGSVVGDFIEIEYRCSSKFVLIGNSSNYCSSGSWLFATPKCESKTHFSLPSIILSINDNSYFILFFRILRLYSA